MLPRTIQIGAHIYKIKMALRKNLGKDVCGDSDHERNIIQVIKHATRSRKIEILIHECLHAMLAGHDFKNEEEIVLILGEALTSFISDNPYFLTEAIAVLSGPKKF